MGERIMTGPLFSSSTFIMTMLECPHCGYVAEKIDFVSCPGCGCQARDAYRQVSAGGEVEAGPSGPSAQRYPGLGLAAADRVPTSEEGRPEESTITRICVVIDHPISSLVMEWYQHLSPTVRAAYDEVMTSFSSPWIKRAIALLGIRERRILFRKVLELVATDMGIQGGSVCCSACTYYLGGASCDLEDLELTAGTVVAGEGCLFFAAQLDTDHMERRLRFLLVTEKNKG